MSKQKHSASSGRWLKEHFDDKYANEARKKDIVHVRTSRLMKSKQKISC